VEAKLALVEAMQAGAVCASTFELSGILSENGVLKVVNI
jgi:hypothetical protein